MQKTPPLPKKISLKKVNLLMPPPMRDPGPALLDSLVLAVVVVGQRMGTLTSTAQSRARRARQCTCASRPRLPFSSSLLSLSPAGGAQHWSKQRRRRAARAQAAATAPNTRGSSISAARGMGSSGSSGGASCARATSVAHDLRRSKQRTGSSGRASSSTRGSSARAPPSSGSARARSDGASSGSSGASNGSSGARGGRRQSTAELGMARA